MSGQKISVVRLKRCHKDQFISFIKRWGDRAHFNVNVPNYILHPYLDPNSKFPVIFGSFIKKDLLFTIGLWKWETLPYANISFLSSKRSYGFL